MLVSQTVDCPILPACHIRPQLLQQLSDRRRPGCRDSRMPRAWPIGDGRLCKPGVVTLLEQANQQRLASTGIAIKNCQQRRTDAQVLIEQLLIIPDDGAEDNTL